MDQERDRRMRFSLARQMRMMTGRRIQAIGYASGAMDLLARLRGVQGALVLMYHSVAGGDVCDFIDPRNRVPADVFEEQIAFLARHRTVLTLSDLVGRLAQGGDIPGNAVVITFDDGYLDNLTVAAPLLHRYGLPATIFLPTRYIEQAEPQWVDQLYSIFQFRSNDRLETSWSDGNEVMQTGTFDLADPEIRQSAYQILCDRLLAAAFEERASLLQTVREQLAPTRECPRLTMSWSDIRRLREVHPDFEIGAHTVEHLDMTSLASARAEKELADSRRQIDTACGVEPRAFSFPYGRCTPELQTMVNRLGFTASCGGGSGPIVTSQTNVFAIPRVAASATISGFDCLTHSANTQFWRRLAR